MAAKQKEVTLEDYKRAQRVLKRESSLRRVMLHFIVFVLATLTVSIVVFIYYPGDPWLLYPLIGWAFGFIIHYLYGVKWIDTEIRESEAQAEYYARHDLA